MKRIRRRIDPSWHQLEVRERVHFYDLDPMERVWHGHYVRFMEVAREAFFDASGLPYSRLSELEMSAPVARMQLEFLAPARGDEELTIRVAAVPPDRCLLELVFEIRGADGRLCCVAESIQAFADAREEVFRTVPAELREFFARQGEVPG